MFLKCKYCKVGQLEPVDFIETIKENHKEYDIYVCVCNHCLKTFYIDLEIGGNDNEN